MADQEKTTTQDKTGTSEKDRHLKEANDQTLSSDAEKPIDPSLSNIHYGTRGHEGPELSVSQTPDDGPSRDFASADSQNESTDTGDDTVRTPGEDVVSQADSTEDQSDATETEETTTRSVEREAKADANSQEQSGSFGIQDAATPAAATGTDGSAQQASGSPDNATSREEESGTTNTNTAPSDIELSSDSVDENAVAGTVVATLLATDQDAGETFTYALVDGAGDPITNSNFEIVGDEIRVRDGADIDFEDAASHALNVRVTDSGGNTYVETVTLSVNDLNEGPTDIALTGGAVDENAVAGTVVATLSATDQDAGETFTYALVDDAGDPLTNSNFEIVGDEIRVRAGTDIDFEDAASHALNVRVTDSGGNTYVEAVTLSVNDLNEGPTDIGLTGGAVDENTAAGTVVATLSATDQDAGETFTYALVDGGGDPVSGGDFEIVGDEVRVRAGADIDFEDAASHALNVRVTDSGGNTYVETVTLSVNDLNEGPTDIALAGGAVDENAVAGTVVATLSATDQDAGETFTYTLVDGAGDPLSDGDFEIVGDEVRVRAGADIDFEDAASHALNVRVTDSGGNTYVETVTLSVNDLNEGPTDIALAGGAVDENAVAGTVVATLSATDQDAGETFTYALVDDAGDPLTNSNFEIVGDEVRVRAGADIDFEDAASHALNVRVTDSGGNTYVETVTVTVNDVDETPPVVGLNISGGSGNDNIVAGAGNDYVDAGYGDDTVYGEAGDDVIRGNRGNDTMYGGDGDDVFTTSGYYEGTDQFHGGDGLDTVQGSGGNDRIYVTSNLENLDSIEVIDGGGGTDTLIGTANDDVLDFSSGPVLQNIEGIDAGYGNDTVTGTAGDDVIRGNRGNDTMYGGDGDDVFTTSGYYEGTDQFHGGDGMDTVQGSGGNDRIYVTSNLDNLDSIEVIDGGGGTDTLIGTANDDVLDFSSGPVLQNIEGIDAGYGNDTVTGTAGDDVIRGNRGNDTMYGGDGDDVFTTSGYYEGTDQFHGGDGLDTVQGSGGNDRIYVTSNLENLDSIEVIDGGGGTDTLIGTANDDVLDFSSGPVLQNIEGIDAGYGNDTVTGTAGDDVIRGNRGNDTMYGGDGDDVFTTSGYYEGTDQFHGGDGLDTVQGSGGNDRIYVTSNLDNLDSIEVIDGGGGTDTLIGTANDDVLDFSSGPVLQNIEGIDAGYGNDTVTGTAGDDVIRGNRGNDTMYGGDGDDVFTTSGYYEGTDQFHGGDGMDTVQGSGGNDRIYVTSNLDNLDSIEVIDGGGGTDTLIGTANDDVLDFSSGPVLQNIEAIDAGYGNDTVTGTAGDDVIRGNRGNDTMYGGDGDDVFTTSGYYEGTDQFHGGDGMDTVQGSGGNDRIYVTSNLDNLDSIEVIDGGGGTDTLIGTANDDVLDFSSGPVLQNIEGIDAGYGNDTVTGTAGDDVIRGNRGNDTMYGGDGDDVFTTSGYYEGTDQFHGGDGMDTVQGSGGNDRIYVTSNLDNLDSIEVIDGGGGTDTLIGTANDDVLDFSSGPVLQNIEGIDAGYGNDTVTGTAGDDVIRGNRGNDTMYGGDGDDVFTTSGYYEGTDQFHGGDGMDTVQGSGGNDRIYVTSNLDNLDSIEVIDGGGGTDTLIGTANDDVLDFSSGPVLQNIEAIDAGYGNDTVTGTAGDDVIRGNRGNDTMYGGDGDDVLDGGDGNDLFLFYEGSGSDQIFGGAGRSWVDTVELRDAEGGDDIGAYGADWTVTVTSGGIVDEEADSITLEQDTSGYVTFSDGSEFTFQDLERIEW